MYKLLLLIVSLVLSLSTLASAQATPSGSTTGTPAARAQDKKQDAALNDCSGMYTFLREGEFVQINIEEQAKVTGFISRYGELDSDRGAFLDQFIDKGRLEDHRLSFVTRPLHGVWFDFKGVVERGKGKTPNEEAYYVLRGTLTRYSMDANKKTETQSREVEFKSFPQDLGNATPRKRD